MPHQSRRTTACTPVPFVLAALVLAACGVPHGDDAGGDVTDANDVNRDTAGQPDTSARCTSDDDCSDGVFCNGAERCAPGAANADGRGCTPASPSTPCLDRQRCDETMQRCISSCSHAPDADGDGHRAQDCGGDDCDDSDPNRFPGNTEVCDAANHDEDCDARSFGLRDTDMDGYVDALCCNTDSMGMRTCGDDCNDSRPNVHPALAETCDGLDNDCNSMVDEGVARTFHADGDGDGFGTATGMTRTGCIPPMGFAEPVGDCDDARSDVHPGAIELCDADRVDENCDGVANPSALCSCSGDVSQPCMQPGACMSGTQRCVGGGWGACSIMPVAEICNGVDDDCDGMTDETLSVTCYPDADNDGYAAAGIASVQSCPVPGRDGFAGCPPNQTNRAPIGIGIDCNDADSTVSPGQPELCDVAARDENCDGIVNPPALCMCTEGQSRPCVALGSCGAGSQTCSGGHWSSCSVNPLPESCNGTDDDCDGMVDEGLTVTCYADADNDGYAAMGTMPIQSCPVAGRDGVGGCPTNQTNRAPIAGAVDCNDANAAVSPAAVELCDAASVDENCDGTANPMSLCACSGSAVQPCPLSGACAAGTQTCMSGTWSSCSILPVTESCNGIDDNCNGSIDEMLTVTCYVDGDNDGFAAMGAMSVRSCPVAGRGYVGGCPTNQTNVAPAGGAIDCNDMAATLSPGATELCNGIDDNCNGMIDEGTLNTFWPDADRDGFGDPTGVTLQRCVQPSGYAANNTDCDDHNSNRRPGLTEICDGYDNDCNNRLDGPGEDDDGDGFADVTCAGAAGTDCDDTRSFVHPMAPELCDRRDDDCSIPGSLGLDPSEDADSDGHAPTTATCAGGMLPKDDCNDTVASVHPGATEACDGTDNDCDAIVDNAALADAQCTRPNTVSACRHAHCMIVGCSPGYVDCNGQANDGCEASNETNSVGCGVCNAECGAASACNAGICDRVVQLVSGWDYACARRSSGGVACWGNNTAGQLGDGTNSLRTFSVPVNLGGVAAADVAVGYRHTCIVSTVGTVYCWGDNTSGQLGVSPGTVPATNVPRQVAGISNAAQVAVGPGHTCIVRTTGQVTCWGDDSAGALGDGATTGIRSTPFDIPGLTDGVSVRANVGSTLAGAFTCISRTSNTASCWGNNASGQLGDGTTTTRPSPVAVTGLTNVSRLDVGGAHACAMRNDGSVWCWGSNSNGQLGDGTMNPHATAAAAMATSATGLDLGGAYTCIVQPGTVSATRPTTVMVCWGDNGSSEWPGSPGNHLMPDNSMVEAAEIAAGRNFTCVRHPSGRVECIGASDTGQTGQPSGSVTSNFGNVGGLTDRMAQVSGVEVGVSHTCTWRPTGEALCWGDNTFGELGTGTTVSSVWPVSVAGVANVRAMAAGDGFTCALRSDRRVLCWGHNNLGQLGDGTSTDRTNPVLVPGLLDAVQISAITSTTCALRATGAVVCWGANNFGQVGNGTTSAFENAPRAATGIANAVRVASGGDHACALRSDGSVVCWGRNLHGQLGDGTTTDHSSPTVVPGIDDAFFVEAGTEASYVVRDPVTDTMNNVAVGTLWSWGRNTTGQLADGSTTERHAPVAATSFFAHTIRNVAPGAGQIAIREATMPRWMGDNSSNQVNAGMSVSLQLMPNAAPWGTADALGTSANLTDTCLVNTSPPPGPVIYCVGANAFGQHGNGTTTNGYGPDGVGIPQ